MNYVVYEHGDKVSDFSICPGEYLILILVILPILVDTTANVLVA
jgi:hypothetical protein